MVKKTAPLKHNTAPPSKSKNVLSDIYYYLLKKPPKDTLIKFDSEAGRKEYNERVLQRVGIDINRNFVLNIHKIGVDAPVSHVFDELKNWNGDSDCWPNHVARVRRVDDKIENIEILPFGIKKYPFGFKKRFLGMNLIPLFSLHAIRIKETPDVFDFDNARYLLYESKGGYPIGIFTMYVRSSIPHMGEVAQSQLISAVSFNFYGKEKEVNRIVGRVWEFVHNRVTANVLNRMKQISEWKLEELENGFH